MKVVILNALGNDVASRCVTSLLATAEGYEFDMLILRERGFREKTLNTAVSLLGSGDDILFVGDDIEFTPGWLQALEQHKPNADIWGMSMLYPDSTKVQDRGYDLVEVHDRIVLEPRERGRNMDQTTPFGWRFCDGVCGCFLYVRKEVFEQVKAFREEEGRNRWGEFIFTAEARKAGARVAVIDHFLHHGGVGTKGHIDKTLSSISYHVEKELWKNISERFIDKKWVRTHRRTAVSLDLLALLRRADQKVLFYGIGTVTEALLYHLGEFSGNFTFVTGLSEETGMDVHGGTVKYVEDLDPGRFDLILITPLHIGEKIFQKHFFSRISTGFKGRVMIINTHQKGDVLTYTARDLRVETEGRQHP